MRSRRVPCSRKKLQDFPGGPVVKILSSQDREPWFDPWSGIWILCAIDLAQPNINSLKERERERGSSFPNNPDFKNTSWRSYFPSLSLSLFIYRVGIIVMPTLQGHGGVKYIQEMVAAMMLPVMILIIMVTYLNLGFGWSINGGFFGMAESEAWNEETILHNFLGRQKSSPFPLEMWVWMACHTLTAATSTSPFPKRSSDLQISFKFSIILFRKGTMELLFEQLWWAQRTNWSLWAASKSCFPYVSLSVAFLMQSWIGEYTRSGEKKNDFVSTAGCPYLIGISRI